VDIFFEPAKVKNKEAYFEETLNTSKAKQGWIYAS
jgi:hypothetical protein